MERCLSTPKGVMFRCVEQVHWNNLSPSSPHKLPCTPDTSRETLIQQQRYASSLNGRISSNLPTNLSALHTGHCTGSQDLLTFSWSILIGHGEQINLPDLVGRKLLYFLRKSTSFVRPGLYAVEWSS